MVPGANTVPGAEAATLPHASSGGPEEFRGMADGDPQR